MNAAWVRLALFVVAGAALLVVLGHRPRQAAPPPEPEPLAPLDTLTVVVRGDSIAPAASERVLRHRLALTRVNAGARAVRLSLAGYEHQLAEATLAPGESRTDTFTLDLPGEDFAWRIDGQPTGRLRVAGPHLVEGHR